MPITGKTKTQPDLARLEATMQKKWYELAMAEQRGLSAHVLERLFAAYMSAFEAFVAAQRNAAAVPATRSHVA